MTGTGPVGGSIQHGGQRIAWLDWNRDAPDVDTLVVLHPSGFCAGVFHPFATRLGHRFRVVGVDLRGHGESTGRPDPADLGNDLLAADVVAVADHLGLERFSILGVSLGGGVGIEVAATCPERVTGLMICEAIAIDTTSSEEVHYGYEDGEHPMAVAARRRRPVWPDRETVVASYGSRQPLCVLHPEILEAYVRWGFHDRPDGQVELACPPEVEAVFFGSGQRYGPVGAYRHLADVACPATVLAGTGTDLEMGWFEAQADRLGVDLIVVDGTHFFIFEDMDRGVGLVLEHLG